MSFLCIWGRVCDLCQSGAMVKMVVLYLAIFSNRFKSRNGPFSSRLLLRFYLRTEQIMIIFCIFFYLLTASVLSISSTLDMNCTYAEKSIWIYVRNYFKRTTPISIIHIFLRNNFNISPQSINPKTFPTLTFTPHSHRPENFARKLNPGQPSRLL